MKDDERDLLSELRRFLYSNFPKPFKVQILSMLLHEALNGNEKFNDLEIPWLNFPSNWLIRPIFPDLGAYVRFVVKDKASDHQVISVYLDIGDNLGVRGSPYWEIYPNVDGDAQRFDMNDTEGLITGIQKAFDSIQLDEHEKE